MYLLCTFQTCLNALITLMCLANSFMLSASPLLHLVALQYIVHAPNHTYIYIPLRIYCMVIGDTLQQWHCFKLLENPIEKVLSQTLGVGYDAVFDL